MRRLRVGVLSPGVQPFGEAASLTWLAAALVGHGHEVTVYVPPSRAGATLFAGLPSVEMSARVDAPLDVVLFAEETQWHLVRCFANTRRFVFYALRHAARQRRPGAWEAVRAPVHLQLANSTWTADQLERETGHRPTVLLPGVPLQRWRAPRAQGAHGVIATPGDDVWWKRNDVVTEAGRLLGLPITRMADAHLLTDPLAALRQVPCDAFVVTSQDEGLGEAGLAALAAGVPLVTTDGGGCATYAMDGETALVVPPDDPLAVAQAVGRLRRDPALVERLRQNAWDLLGRTFDVAERASSAEAVLQNLVETAQDPLDLWPKPAPAEEVRLSAVVLTWDGLPYTQQCVESLRRHTDVPWHLVVVDNGSHWEAQNYASAAADMAVIHDHNTGFAAGMNAGLAAAQAPVVAFCNNDTVFPPQWATRLTGTLDTTPGAGIVVPSVTSAANFRTVRNEPADAVEVLDPFELPPSAVCYVMHRALAQQLGGWGEEYAIASAEDLDLCFKVWVNGLEVVHDERVLLYHVGKATTAAKIADWRSLWRDNGRLFLQKWSSPELDVRRVAACPEHVHERGVRTARAAAGWMDAYFTLRENQFLGKWQLRKMAWRLERLSNRFAGSRRRGELNAGGSQHVWEHAVGLCRHQARNPI